MTDLNDLPESDFSSVPPELRGANGFVPLTLLAVSFIIILSWELIVASHARSNARQLGEQQAKMVEQSKKVQTGLEKLARDLIEVSASDDDAKAIVKKYQINVTNPAPGASPAAATTATP